MRRGKDSTSVVKGENWYNMRNDKGAINVHP